MKIIATKTLLLFIIVLSFFSTKAADTTKVLFIGNSITYFNDMPQTFEDIANSLGQTCDITMCAPGGTGFANHVTNPAVYDLFRESNWDYIVLQPGTGDSGGESIGGTPIETSLVRIRTLLDSIYHYNPCSQVLFFEISNGVWSNSESDLATYNASMDLIFSNVKYFSDSTKLPLAPVGEAFRTSWNNDLNTLLWNSTGDIHPNPKGSYLAACVFYSSIFQEPSLGSIVTSSLTSNEAAQYQYIADTTVLNHQINWNMNTFDQFTDFNYSVILDSVQFENLSLNIDSLLWDFGDGAFSEVLNPSHIYTSIGQYDISLTTYKHGCADTLTETVEILTLPYSKIQAETSITVYPNPANKTLWIDTNTKDSTCIFELYNCFGELVLMSHSSKIDISQFQSGLYYLKVTDASGSKSEVLKWIKR